VISAQTPRVCRRENRSTPTTPIDSFAARTSGERTWTGHIHSRIAGIIAGAITSLVIVGWLLFLAFGYLSAG
jgi:hypothetical protein